MRVGPVLIHDKGEAPAEWVLGDDIGLTTSVLLAAGLLAVGGAAVSTGAPSCGN